MNTEFERIEAKALQLSVEDRERLIEALIESLDREVLDRANGATTGEFGGFATAELQKYWLDEAERRMHLIRSGHMKTFPVDEVMAEARAMLKAARENQ